MAVPVELAFAPLAVLGKKLRAGEFSSVELTRFFLDRLDRPGRRLNAVVTIADKSALREAEQADRELAAGTDRGPLHGIPYGAKDLLATRDLPTSWGAAPYKDRVIDTDATVITKLRKAGAVLVAKLAMVEIAGGMGYKQANASFTGPGLNPWNEKSWAGGSSSGSGSAVGGGIVPFAIGSETFGSIVTPAGYCGVTGLRPTYGRVSRHGAMALSWTMDKLGPMCRTAEDCGLVLNAIAGPDPDDPSAVDRPYVYPDATAPSPPFKLAVIKGAADKVQPEIRANYNAALEALRKFSSLEEIELPDLPYSPVASTLIACEMAAAFEPMVNSGDAWELEAPEDRVGAYAAMFIPAKDYIHALRIRRVIEKSIDALLAQFDAVVTPGQATVAPPLDRDFSDYQTGFRSTQIGGAGNVAGAPAVIVPNGFGERNLPTSLQFVGRAFEENRLIAIATAYQAATDWHTRHPSL